MKNRFTSTFNTYACAHDTIQTIEIAGVIYTATIVHDCTSDIDDDDCHNTDQSVTGCSDDQHEKLLAARKAWLGDDWFYCGIVISGNRDGWINDHLNSLWGLGCNYPGANNSHLTMVANELLTEYLKENAIAA